MNVNWKRYVAALACSLLLVSLGCDSGTDTLSESGSTETAGAAADGHNHGDGHDHDAADMSEALAHLNEHCTKIKTAFEGNSPEDAHDSLHEVGQLLESIPALAEKKGLSSEQVGTVKEQVEALFDAFTTLDETMHGGDAVEYSEVDAKIQDAMSKLQEMAK